MRDIFLELLNRSITAGWLILAILVLRLALRKAPRWISCLLWGLAAFRLICPFSLESVFSMVPSRETVRADIVGSPSPSIDSGVKAVDNIVNPVLKQTFRPETGAAVNSLQIALTLAAAVWIAGLLVMVSYAAVGYIRLRLRVRTAVRLSEPVYVSEFVDTPFILGVFRPRIYLPAGMPEEMQAAVLAHERAHLKRWDHLWKALGYGLLAVYWFHPLCWAAYILFCRDIELACDERAIRDYAPGQRRSYSEALLFCSVSGGHQAAACPLAFGEIGAKERIRSVLNYKKPAFWMVVTALVACVIVGVCFLTDPVRAGQESGQGEEGGEGNNGGPGETGDRSDAGNPGGADQEGNSGQPAGNNGGSDQSESDLTAFLRQWTAAFVNRDGGSIAALASEEALADLRERDLLQGSAGSYSFGESSLWPLDPEADVWVIDRGEGTAKINYYAWTSERYATVWTERLSFEERDGSYVVTGEELTWHDAISSAEEFQEAYPFLNGTRMDYLTNGAGLWENVLLSSYRKAYEALYEPETAAVRLLNLTEDSSEMTVERLWENDNSFTVGLQLTFLRGAKYSVEINMVCLGGIIWVPQDYYLEPAFQLRKVDWDAVRRQELSVGDELSQEGIRCIARIPEEEITLYGADNGEGVTVELGRERFFYNWLYNSPRDILPDCCWDKSGSRLQVALNVYTGTGADAQELHVLQYRGGDLRDNTLDLTGYSGLLYERISFAWDQESHRITLTDSKDGSELAVCDTGEIEGTVRELELGCISRFLLGEKLSLQVETGYYPEEQYGVAEYDGMPVLRVEILTREAGDGSLLFELGEIRLAE